MEKSAPEAGTNVKARDFEVHRSEGWHKHGSVACRLEAAGGCRAAWSKLDVVFDEVQREERGKIDRCFDTPRAWSRCGKQSGGDWGGVASMVGFGGRLCVAHEMS
jgi:hypothetical protein